MSSTYDSSDPIFPTSWVFFKEFCSQTTLLPLGMGPISLRNVGAAYANDDARNRFG